MNENTPVIASEAKQSSMQEDDEISLLDLLQVVAENARLLILGPLLIGLAALGWAYTITPTFTATTTILPPQQQSSASAALAQLGALAGLAGAAGGAKSPADMYMGLFKSRAVADRMIDRFELMETYGAEYRESARNSLAGQSEFIIGKDGMITIAVVDKDPKRAAAMANAYVDELARVSGGLAMTEAQQRRQFLEKELAKAKASLVRAEVALGGTGVSESLLKFNPVAMGEGLASLKAQVVAKEIQLASMRSFLTTSSPDFNQARQELAALREQLAKAEHPRAAGANAEYVNRYRDFKYTEVLFEQLAKQYELAKIDESREGGLIQVVDVAEPPAFKTNPKKALIAIQATLVTGFILVLFVFVRRALRNADAESAAKLATIRSSLRRALRP